MGGGTRSDETVTRRILSRLPPDDISQGMSWVGQLGVVHRATPHSGRYLRIAHLGKSIVDLKASRRGGAQEGSHGDIQYPRAPCVGDLSRARLSRMVPSGQHIVVHGAISQRSLYHWISISSP